MNEPQVPHGYVPPPSADPTGPAPAYAQPTGPLPPYAQPTGPLPPYGQPVGPKKTRSRAVAFGAVGAAVLVLATGGVAAGFLLGKSNSGDGAGSPADAVRGYFEALGRGDAEGVLSFVANRPSDKRFLTDEVLKKQYAATPISNIQTFESDENSVHVSVDFGGKQSDSTVYGIAKIDGRYKLQNGLTTIPDVRRVVSEKALSIVTLFGQPFPVEGGTPMFPGPVEVGSSSPNYEVSLFQQKLPTAQRLGVATTNGDFLLLDLKLTNTGKDKAIAAATQLSLRCAASKQIAPEGCPQRAVDTDRESVVDGTVTWTAPAIDNLRTIMLDKKTATARILTGAWRYNAQRKDLPSYPGFAMGGTIAVDLTVDPPTTSIVDGP